MTIKGSPITANDQDVPKVQYGDDDNGRFIIYKDEHIYIGNNLGAGTYKYVMAGSVGEEKKYALGFLSSAYKGELTEDEKNRELAREGNATKENFLDSAQKWNQHRANQLNGEATVVKLVHPHSSSGEEPITEYILIMPYLKGNILGAGLGIEHDVIIPESPAEKPVAINRDNYSDPDSDLADINPEQQQNLQIDLSKDYKISVGTMISTLSEFLKTMTGSRITLDGEKKRDDIRDKKIKVDIIDEKGLLQSIVDGHLLTAIPDVYADLTESFHDKGLLYRDVKTGNIWVFEDGKSYLIDPDNIEKYDKESGYVALEANGSPFYCYETRQAHIKDTLVRSLMGAIDDGFSTISESIKSQTANKSYQLMQFILEEAAVFKNKDSENQRPDKISAEAFNTFVAKVTDKFQTTLSIDITENDKIKIIGFLKIMVFNSLNPKKIDSEANELKVKAPGRNQPESFFWQTDSLPNLELHRQTVNYTPADDIGCLGVSAEELLTHYLYSFGFHPDADDIDAEDLVTAGLPRQLENPDKNETIVLLNQLLDLSKRMQPDQLQDGEKIPSVQEVKDEFAKIHEAIINRLAILQETTVENAKRKESVVSNDSSITTISDEGKARQSRLGIEARSGSVISRSDSVISTTSRRGSVIQQDSDPTTNTHLANLFAEPQTEPMIFSIHAKDKIRLSFEDIYATVMDQNLQQNGIYNLHPEDLSIVEKLNNFIVATKSNDSFENLNYEQKMKAARMYVEGNNANINFCISKAKFEGLKR